jgi:hypothetical protein
LPRLVGATPTFHSEGRRAGSPTNETNIKYEDNQKEMRTTKQLNCTNDKNETKQNKTERNGGSPGRQATGVEEDEEELKAGINGTA